MSNQSIQREFFITEHHFASKLEGIPEGFSSTVSEDWY